MVADDRYRLPEHEVPRGPDWPRVSRWSFLGALVMLVWLLSPTIQCSWNQFFATPLSEEEQETLALQGEAGDADRQRVVRAKGFVARWTEAIKICYADAPLLGQERWKSILLFAFTALMLVSWLLGQGYRHSRPR